MPLSASERKALAARGHHLRPRATLGESEVNEPTIEHVRRLFDAADLVKIRVNTRDRDAFAAIVTQLAHRVPCQIVQRIGRVALLYHPAPRESSA